MFSPYKIAALQLAQVGILSMAIFFLVAGIILFRRGFSSAKYYLIAWGFLIVGLFLGMMESLNLIPIWHNINAMQAGSAVEVTLLSLALADRINRLKREKALAQENLIKETQEKADIIKNQNILLEEKVNERTQELNETLKLVNKEKDRSDKLLLNILPYKTAAELKENGHVEAKAYEDVTVMFSDFINFTETASNLAPKELVSLLDDYFIEFDKVTTDLGIEKIKTIGDAYMCAIGLHQEFEHNPLIMIQAAQKMLAFVEKLKTESETTGRPHFDIRIGIHTGPVVSGVVGIKKFAYDIWGDTVNIAARMEQTCDPGKVNISQATVKKVKEFDPHSQLSFTSRGKIKVKGKGEMEMFYLS